MKNLMYDFIQENGKKASSEVGEPPYRKQGSTESQAQQKAAGAALAVRRGDAPASALKGASKEMVKMKLKDLTALARLGDPVKKHKGVKEPETLEGLPGRVTPKKEEIIDYQSLLNTLTPAQAEPEAEPVEEKLSKEIRIENAKSDWNTLCWRLRGFEEEQQALKRLSWIHGVTIEEILQGKSTKSQHQQNSQKYFL